MASFPGKATAGLLVAALLTLGWWGAARAQATGQPPIAPPECSPNAISCVRYRIEWDNSPAVAGLYRDPDARMYYVQVTLQNGRTYTPITGAFDPASDRVTLTLRRGHGDLRCRHWVPDGFCRYLVNMPPPQQMLYLSHSRQGDFALQLRYPHDYRSTAPDGGLRTDGEFVVIPALEGPVTVRPRQ